MYITYETKRYIIIWKAHWITSVIMPEMQLTIVCARIHNRIKAFCLSGWSAQSNDHAPSPSSPTPERNTQKKQSKACVQMCVCVYVTHHCGQDPDHSDEEEGHEHVADGHIVRRRRRRRRSGAVHTEAFTARLPHACDSHMLPPPREPLRNTGEYTYSWPRNAGKQLKGIPHVISNLFALYLLARSFIL